MPNLTVVLPTYNEAENLELMVEALLALNIEDLHVLIVDDNSPDGTGEIADDLAEKYIGWVNVHHNPGKGGLGPAYRIGITRAIEEGADLVLQMDTDFSHQPEYIPSMIEALYERDADMVLGSRYVRGGSVDERWGFHRKLLSFWANRIYGRAILGLPINDATGGFRLWRKEALLGLGLERINSNGYVYLVELAFVAHKLGLFAIHRLDQAGVDQRADLFVQGAARGQPEFTAELIERRWRQTARAAFAQVFEQLTLSGRQRKRLRVFHWFSTLSLGRTEREQAVSLNAVVSDVESSFGAVEPEAPDRVAALVGRLKRKYQGCITAEAVTPAQPGRYQPIPDHLDPRLLSALQSRGIRELYSHQAQAWRVLHEGAHCVIATPTASGKTLCFNGPVLNAALQHEAKALYLFPTKALAQDQVAN